MSIYIVKVMLFLIITLDLSGGAWQLQARLRRIWQLWSDGGCPRGSYERRWRTLSPTFRFTCR